LFATVIGTIFAVVNTAGAVANVVASVVGTPNVFVGGSVNVLGDIRASIIGVPSMVASTIGTIFAVVNTAGAVANVEASVIGTPNIFVGGSVNVLGDVRASLIGVPSVVASVIGTIFAVHQSSLNILGDVRASLIGVPSVVASVAGTLNAWVGGSVNVFGTVVASVIGQQPVTATIAGFPTVIASVIGAPVVLASVSGIHGVTISSINVAAPQPVHFFGPAVANMGFTSVIIQLAGSGIVVGNLLASNAARVAVAGYQIVSAGTCYFAFYDGTINAPLTGCISLIPNSGMVVQPSPIPLMLTTSGRGITAGLSASCPIAGNLQYWIPPG